MFNPDATKLRICLILSLFYPYFASSRDVIDVMRDHPELEQDPSWRQLKAIREINKLEESRLDTTREICLRVLHNPTKYNEISFRKAAQTAVVNKYEGCMEALAQWIVVTDKIPDRPFGRRCVQLPVPLWRIAMEELRLYGKPVTPALLDLAGRTDYGHAELEQLLESLIAVSDDLPLLQILERMDQTDDDGKKNIRYLRLFQGAFERQWKLNTKGSLVRRRFLRFMSLEITVRLDVNRSLLNSCSKRFLLRCAQWFEDFPSIPNDSKVEVIRKAFEKWLGSPAWKRIKILQRSRDEKPK